MPHLKSHTGGELKPRAKRRIKSDKTINGRTPPVGPDPGKPRSEMEAKINPVRKNPVTTFFSNGPGPDKPKKKKKKSEKKKKKSPSTRPSMRKNQLSAQAKIKKARRKLDEGNR